MKKNLLFLVGCSFLLLSACSNDTGKAENDKIKLVFRPLKDKPVKISYNFTVNQLSSGDVTGFRMLIAGRGETAADGTVMLELKNESIKMSGILQGNEVSGSASGADSLSGDAKLVAMPVFGLIDRTYLGTYTGQFDKKTEVQVKDGAIVDSSENKMQFFLRYPSGEVGTGDSWEKQIVIKAGNKMNCAAKYTLKEIKGDTAVIAMEGRLSGEGESFGNEFTMDGKLSGTFLVDVHTGWPLDTEIDQAFTLKMGGKEIPMKYAIKSKVE
ncbi:MAG: hypothetical protein JWO44_1401 [Bacteroidetes bacterium]|nr:hypothetical protein [Bacteroidota bacterium]